jgi:hypothetical protein
MKVHKSASVRLGPLLRGGLFQQLSNAALGGSVGFLALS